MLMPVGRYHQNHVLGRRVRTLARHLAELAPREASVLDVGCGDGLLARDLQQQRPDLRLSGVDVLVREHTAVPVTPFDGTTLPLAANSVDAVLFVDVLHHTTDPRVLLREAVRVSRRWVIIKDHRQDGWLARPTLCLMDWVGNARHGVALPYNYWRRRQWEEAFATLGLRSVETRTRLEIYPAWADWLFGRGLHFIAVLEKQANRPADT